MFLLLSDFKRWAQPQIRCLWADLMEVAEATDEQSVSVASEQALRRIHVLGRAARAANAGQVQLRDQTLELRLRVLTQASEATRPQLLEDLYEAMRDLVRAQCSIDLKTMVADHRSQPAEMALVEVCAD